VNALFIGNSYTGFHGLPWAVQAMAAAAGKPLTVAASIHGGKGLQWHWQEGDARDTIAGGAAHAVILQDHSLGTLEAPDVMFDYARKFDALIREHGAQTVFYLTWARQYAPGTQQQITDAYVTIARELGARVAPVGVAWQEAMKRSPELVLHLEDASHPTQEGSYLAACVFFATLLGESPVGLPAAIHVEEMTSMELDESLARLLQDVAWECVEGVDGS